MNCINERFHFIKSIGKLLSVVCFVALLIPNGSFAAEEKFGTRYDTGTYQGNYNYVYSLAANTEHARVGTSYQKSGVTLKSKAAVSVGSFTGFVYRLEGDIRTSTNRSVYYEWRRDQTKIGAATDIVSTHIIAGSIQKTFYLNYFEGTLPQPY